MPLWVPCNRWGRGHAAEALSKRLSMVVPLPGR